MTDATEKALALKHKAELARLCYNNADTWTAHERRQVEALGAQAAAALEAADLTKQGGRHA